MINTTITRLIGIKEGLKNGTNKNNEELTMQINLE